MNDIFGNGNGTISLCNENGQCLYTKQFVILQHDIYSITAVVGVSSDEDIFLKVLIDPKAKGGNAPCYHSNSLQIFPRKDVHRI